MVKIQSATNNYSTKHPYSTHFDDHNDGLGVFLERLCQKMSILQSFIKLSADLWVNKFGMGCFCSQLFYLIAYSDHSSIIAMLMRWCIRWWSIIALWWWLVDNVNIGKYRSLPGIMEKSSIMHLTCWYTWASCSHLGDYKHIYLISLLVHYF